MIRRTGWGLAVLWPLLLGSAHADEQPTRPAIKTNRWQEDWSVLKDPALRTQLVLAAILCGQGTDYTGGGITTVLGHAIGARCDIENGLANAILLPHVLRFNASAAREGLAKIRQALGMEGASDEAMIESIRRDIERLGVPARLSVAGVPDDAVERIAESAMGDWFLQGNPRRVEDVEQLQEILRSAW